MALCLACSLVARGNFNAYDQLVRYKWWYRNGYMSSTGTCFDIGSATSQSLHEFERRQKQFANEHKIPIKQLDFLSDDNILSKFDVICSEEGVAGNGALMRLAPVPLFFYKNPAQAVKLSGISGRITHGDQKAYDACRYYGALIVATLHGESKEQLLDENFYLNHQNWFNGEALHPDIMQIAEGSYKKEGGYDDGIRGKGYIVNALEAALWAFNYDDNSFKKGVLAAVNLGDDTDTTAAIYGQLAGAYYGYKQVPSDWAEQVYAKKFIETLSKWIVYEAQKQKTGEPLPPTPPSTLTTQISYRSAPFSSWKSYSSSTASTLAAQKNSRTVPISPGKSNVSSAASTLPAELSYRSIPFSSEKPYSSSTASTLPVQNSSTTMPFSPEKPDSSNASSTLPAKRGYTTVTYTPEKSYSSSTASTLAAQSNSRTAPLSPEKPSLSNSASTLPTELSYRSVPFSPEKPYSSNAASTIPAQSSSTDRCQSPQRNLLHQLQLRL